MDTFANLLPLLLLIAVLWPASRLVRRLGNRERRVIDHGPDCAGIGGWLLLLILGLLLIGPVVALSRLVASINYAEVAYPILASLPEWRTYTVSMWAVQTAAVLLSIHAGWRLLKENTVAAVRTARYTLWLIGPLSSALGGLFLPWAIFGRPDLSAETLGALAGSALGAALWHAYLSRSRRVANTYRAEANATSDAVEGEYIAAGESAPASAPPSFAARLAGALTGPSAGAIGLAFIAALLIYMIAVLAAAIDGIASYWGGLGAALVVVACFFLRFTLPLTVGAFLGAYQVWGWPLVLALLFVAPGLVFVIPGIFAALLAPLLRYLEGRSKPPGNQ